jgi:hypothetical protein
MAAKSAQGNRVQQELEALRSKHLASERRDKLKDCACPAVLSFVLSFSCLCPLRVVFALSSLLDLVTILELVVVVVAAVAAVQCVLLLSFGRCLLLSCPCYVVCIGVTVHNMQMQTITSAGCAVRSLGYSVLLEGDGRSLCTFSACQAVAHLCRVLLLGCSFCGP